ncbi:PepSY domain-containing protein [bacterium]|nr:MAG: PepSY domain-containing protein [bacterium]
MKAAIATSLLIGCVVFGNAPVHAHGNVSCSEPKAEWKARVDLQKKLKTMGWTIRDIKIENGCYEVYGFDDKDAKVEAFFNPRTFERVVEAR